MDDFIVFGNNKSELKGDINFSTAMAEDEPEFNTEPQNPAHLRRGGLRFFADTGSGQHIVFRGNAT